MTMAGTFLDSNYIENLFKKITFNFYGALFGGYKSEGPENNTISGFQGDLTFGVSFSFKDLSSLVLALRWVFQLIHLMTSSLKTKTLNTVQGAIHFYL